MGPSPQTDAVQLMDAMRSAAAAQEALRRSGCGAAVVSGREGSMRFLRKEDGVKVKQHQMHSEGLGSH